MTPTIQINEANFANEVLRARQPVLVEFWSGWRQLSVAMKEVAAECRGVVKMVAVNLDENPGLRSRLRINFLPAVLYFVNGRIRGRAIGAVSKQVIRLTMKGRCRPVEGATLSLTTPIMLEERTRSTANNSRTVRTRATSWIREFLANVVVNFRAPILMPDSFGFLPWRFDFSNPSGDFDSQAFRPSLPRTRLHPLTSRRSLGCSPANRQ